MTLSDLIHAVETGEQFTSKECARVLRRYDHRPQPSACGQGFVVEQHLMSLKDGKWSVESAHVKTMRDVLVFVGEL